MPDGSVSQRTRLGKFHSPLGPDTLALVRFGGDEGINTLGAFRVDVLSPTGIVDLDALLGLHGTVEIATLQHGPRFYDGIITEAELIEERADGWLAQLVLRPWFWLAGLRRNQRIFHEKTAPQIIAEVLGDYAHPHEARLQHSYQPIEYTVQYGESDLAFICRMMERHGLSYHFEHRLAGHVMVMTDAMESFRAAPGGARVFHPVTRQHRVEDEHFQVWSAARRVNTGRVRLTDYNFKTPTAAMPVDQSGGAIHAEGEIESYDYPGHYLAQGVGRGVARLRAEQDRAADGLFVAKGDTASLSPGMLVTLTNHPDTGLNGKQFLLRNATHTYVAEAYASSAEAGDAKEDSYKGNYTFHPQATPFQPAMITPLARIYGPQTAVVVGEGEIDCDEYGRILVRFHWDLDAAHSMRCRVAQIWAGNGWGGMVIPRIGMEVLVEFLEGDPDKPLVTGCVYNGKNKVPYPLPAHKTRSTFRTDTHQGNGFNELRFEDEKGREEIYLHAQKDLYAAVEDNAVRIIGNNDFDIVQDSRLSTVAHIRDDETGWVHIRRIGFADIKIVSADSGILSQLTFPEKVDSSWSEFHFLRQLSQLKALGMVAGGGVEPFSSLTMIAGASTTTVGKDYSLRIGGNQDVTVAGSQSVDVEGRMDMTAETTLSSTAGTTNEIYAGDAIVLAVGGATISMMENGDIDISGRNITINGQKVDIN